MSSPSLVELKAILRLAGPLIAAQLAYVAMVFTDTVMMGKLGPDALAAGGLGAVSYAFVSTFCVGVVAAVGNLVAIRHGCDDAAGAAAAARSGLWVGAALALAAGLLLWNLRPLLLLFGQAPQTVDGAMQFLHSLTFALPGYMAFMVLRGFTSAIDRAGPVMAISVLGALANLALNYSFIEGLFGLPRLGLAGIGLVTALVMNCMPLLLALYIRRQPAYAAYSLLRGLGRPQRAMVEEILRLGLPIGGTYAVMPELFLTMDRLIREGRLEEACKAQYAANDIIAQLCACHGNLYAVMKKVLEKREGLLLGSVRAPLSPISEADLPQIEKCAAMIDDAVRAIGA